MKGEAYLHCISGIEVYGARSHPKVEKDWCSWPQETSGRLFLWVDDTFGLRVQQSRV